MELKPQSEIRIDMTDTEAIKKLNKWYSLKEITEMPVIVFNKMKKNLEDYESKNDKQC